jgi:hypothetical protein
MNPKKFEKSIVNQYEYDVVIVGGGTTGCCAALAAARTGAKTALIELNGYLGGNACSSLPWLALDRYITGEEIIGGIPREIINRLQSQNNAGNIHLDPVVESDVWVNPSALKIELIKMMNESDVRLFLHTGYVGLEMENDRVEGVYISNKQGFSFISSKIVIDCTESGDVVRDTGTEYFFGRESDSKPQVSSNLFRIGNVDMEELISYFEHNPDQMRPYKKEVLDVMIPSLRTTHSFVMGAFPALIEKAKADGCKFPRDVFTGVAFPKIKEIVSVLSRVQNVNPFDNENFTSSENEGYLQVEHIMWFVRKYMPGGQNAYLVADSGTIGIRETNHFDGEYRLTEKDMMESRRFEDGIAVACYYLDKHTPEDIASHLKKIIKTPVYYIPYSCLIPKNKEGILMAGRHISATSTAESSFRMIPILASIGQAAGTAAALSVREGRGTREVDIEYLKAKLIEDGIKLNHEFSKEDDLTFK